MAKNTTYRKIPGYKGLSIGFYNGKDEKYWVARVFYNGSYKEKIIRRTKTTLTLEHNLRIKYHAKNPEHILAVEYWHDIRWVPKED